MPDQPDLDGLTARTEELLDGLATLATDPPTPEQIARLRAGLARAERTLVVVGERNRGKSSLVNALVGAELLPVDAIAATAATIFVRHGSRPAQATVLTEDGVDFQEVRDLSAWATTARTGAGQVARIDVWCDSPLLSGGVVLVDTPGVGGLDENHRDRTMTALRQADAVLLVLDAHQPVSDSEIVFLKEAADLAGAILFAFNKIDDRSEADWTDVLAGNQGLIETCDPRYAGARIHPVSARLALESASADGELGAELLEESRIDDLRQVVRDTLLRDGDLLRLASTTGFCTALLKRLRAESPPPSAGSAEGSRRLRDVEAARAKDAAWRVAFNDDRDRLAKDVRRVGRKQLEKRLQRVSAAADRRLPAGELAERAAEELEALVAVLGRRAEDGLRDLRAGVVTALRLEDLVDVVADFATPRVGSVRANPATEDVWKLAEMGVSATEMMAALGGVTLRKVLKSLSGKAATKVGLAAVPGIAGAGAAAAAPGAAAAAPMAGAAAVPVAGAAAAVPVAGAGAAVAAPVAGVGAGAAVAAPVAGAAAAAPAAGAVVAAPAAGAAEVVVGTGVATAATVLTVAAVTIAVAAVSYAIYREFVKLKAAAVVDETAARGDELTRRTVDDLLAFADQLEKVVDARLRRRAESFAASEEEQNAAADRRRQLDDWDERCRVLRADIATRLPG
ncbi:dynamin family protein [Dactylosporangium sp. CA-092794]|uniref:dynamin family protein n=1 Tax=Dactylosporangium sp. CA-092794 TaxID=3239929 RepID=UPI003D947886